MDNTIFSSKFPIDSGLTAQVLWSFISGRGSMLASFMGKGVTSWAALSLCHLLQTSSRLNPPEVQCKDCINYQQIYNVPSSMCVDYQEL